MDFTFARTFATKLEDEQNGQTAGDIDCAVINRQRARRYKTLVKFIKQTVDYDEE